MYSLNLRTVRSPYNDTTKGSVLSQEEVDNNFINLKGDSIFSSSTDNGVVSLMKLNGETIEFTGGGTATFNTITKIELDNLISTSGLTEGTFYKILNVDIDLYGGTDIILQATSQSTLSSYGNGVFYNPDYELYNIWSDKTKILINNQVGNFLRNEDITADNGATGSIIGLPGTETLILTQVSGDWTTVANITGDSSSTTADMLSFEYQPNYAIGDKVIWGGRVWVNLNGNLGKVLDNMTLDSEWELVSFNEIDYIKVSDVIGYEIDSDHIFYRKNRQAEITCISELLFYSNSIQKFPWGNNSFFNININNGIINNLINYGGISFSDLNISLLGVFDFDYIGKNSSIENLTINSFSYFVGLILGDENKMQNIHLEESTSIIDIVIANKDNINSDSGINNIKLNQGINFDLGQNNVSIKMLILYPDAYFNNIVLGSAAIDYETTIDELTLNNETKMFNINLGQASKFYNCSFGHGNIISEVNLGIFSSIFNFTSGSDCSIININLDGGSGQLMGNLSNHIGEITLYNSVSFININVGLGSRISTFEVLDYSNFSGIHIDSYSSITIINIGEGSSFSGIKLGIYSELNNINVGGNSSFTDIILNEQASLESITIGDFSLFFRLNIGILTNVNTITLSNNSELSNFSLGIACEMVQVNLDTNIVVSDITIGDSCFLNTLTISDNISKKIISKGFNNFPAELDITSMTSLPISPISYAGEITLTSSNSSETVNLINLGQRLYPVTLKPVSGLTLNITGTPAASIGFITQVLSPVATITLNGDTHDQATIITNNSYTRVIDYKNYL